MVKLIKGGGHGLDFGSGPGPTLSVMFEEQGYEMEVFDYFYANDNAVFNKTYDFITCTETIEHLHNPAIDLQRLWGVLKASGYLGIMTKLVKNRDRFSTWHYKNDPTHVCFFSIATFDWLAKQWQASITYEGDDVIIIKKSPKKT